MKLIGERRFNLESWTLPNVVSVALLLVSAFLWINAAWPISMSPDSTDVWNQVVTQNYNDWHPVTYSLLMRFVSFGGKSLVLISIIQTIFTIFTIYKFLTYFFPQLSLAKKFNTTSLLLITPYFGAMSTTLWKDIPYTILLILGFLYGFRSTSLKSRDSLKSALCLTLGIAMRHDAPLVLGVLCLLCLILLRKFTSLKAKAKVLRLVALLTLSIVLSGITHASIREILSIEATTKSVSTAHLLAGLGYTEYFHPEKMTQEASLFVDRVSGPNSFSAFQDCRWGVPFYYSEDFNHKFFEDNWKQIPGIYLRTIPKAWPSLLYAHICRSASYLPPPISDGPKLRLWTILSIYEPNPQSIKASSPIPNLRSLMQGWRNAWESRSDLFSWTGLIVILFLWLASRYQRRLKTDDDLIPALFLLKSLVITQWFFLLLFGAAPDARYALVIHWLTLCFACPMLVDHVTFYKRGSESSKGP